MDTVQPCNISTPYTSVDTLAIVNTPTIHRLNTSYSSIGMPKNNWDEFIDAAHQSSQPQCEYRPPRIVYKPPPRMRLGHEKTPLSVPWVNESTEATTEMDTSMSPSHTSSKSSEASSSSVTSPSLDSKSNPENLPHLTQEASAETISLEQDLQEDIDSSSNTNFRNPSKRPMPLEPSTSPSINPWYFPEFTNLDLDIGPSTDLAIVMDITDYIQNKLSSGEWSTNDSAAIRKWARDQSIRMHDIKFSRTTLGSARLTLNYRLNDPRRQHHAASGEELREMDLAGYTLPLYSAWMRFGYLEDIPVLEGEGSWAGPKKWEQEERERRECPKEFWAAWDKKQEIRERWEKKEEGRRRQDQMRRIVEAGWKKLKPSEWRVPEVPQ